MSDSILQIAPYLLAAVAFGAVVGWLIRTGHGKRSLKQQNDEWHVKFDEAIRQRDRFNAENAKLRSSIEAQQAVVHRHEYAATQSRTELESVREKTKAMSKDIFVLSSQRDELKGQASKSHNALNVANQQIAEFEAEFVKAGQIYKGELEKAFEKRKALETKVDDAKLEHESLSNLLAAAKSEHAAVNKMLASAQTRLGNLDILEQNVIKLEAENAQLRHEATLAKQEIQALQRDVAELDEIKVQNRELAHCLESMEDSRRQHERDAQRYREQAGKSEQKSETMRMKLDDVEQNFAHMERQQDEAKKVVRKKEMAQQSNGQNSEAQQVDDLTEIIGIGKVFQQTLHSLGICSFSQIAAFGPADVARVNMELKEFKGRMEQDDWIGQAKDLHFKKYGDAEPI